jgi:hypothetical protein
MEIHKAQTAELIGLTLRKVAYWSVHGDPENLGSLKDNRMKVLPKEATKYINLLLETVEIDPEKNMVMSSEDGQQLDLQYI